jgi:hypothetical protein
MANLGNGCHGLQFHAYYPLDKESHAPRDGGTRMLPRHPTTLISQVVTRTSGIKEDRVHLALGTAFLVDKGIFMSAKHVFGVVPDAGHELAAVHLDGRNLTGFALQVIYKDPVHDIAVARAEQWPDLQPLVIAPADNLTMNINVLTVEYSATRSGVPRPDGQSAMHITPSFHKGYIVREYATEFGFQGTTSCIELSYPALKGASGAPVIEESSGNVLGMIIRNVEQQLMPAQIERTMRTDGTRDEVIRYFMPTAQAIRASHLREALSHAQEYIKEQ